MGEVVIGIIGGTGLGERLADAFGASLQAVEIDTPLGRPSGAVLSGELLGTRVAILGRHGAGHTLNPSAVPYRANIFALKTLGVTHLIASGATGSLRENIHPGEIVLVDQFIDKTVGRERTFYERAAVHVEFAEPVCPVMRRWLADAAEREGLHCHDGGTYVCMEGPAFSTRAESEMHRTWGGDLIGMTALPEAKLAREAEMAYALIGLPTDYDCWRPAPEGVARESLLGEIIGNLSKASEASVRLIRAALSDVSSLRAAPSAAHEALALAIWSDKARIDAGEVKRLGPLWGRYFA
ncbi:MAG: MTAP family purine nucleoside phosphorylase [Phycisphaerales bacterium]|nr:MTAP family purine nucleoside phosphorylase [Phycisphaerales bacterium]